MSQVDVPANVALDPVDWFLAGWRNLPPLPLPPPAPFDQERCLLQLGKVKLVTNSWNWEPAGIAPSLTAEEARFWLWAMAHAADHLGARDLVKQMRKQAITEAPSVEQLKAGFSKLHSGLSAELAPVLWAVYSPEEFLRGYFALWPSEDKERKLAGSYGGEAYWGEGGRFCAGFLRYVRPYLSREQLQPLQANISPLFRQRFAAMNQVPSSLANLTRAVDLHEEIGMLMASYPDGSFSSPSLSGPKAADFLVFGLGSAEAVLHHLKRLGVRLGTGDAVRALLAHTGTTALGLIRDHILACISRSGPEEMAEVFSLVRTPEMAPLMLELIQANKGAIAARRWLESNPELAAEGLLPLAGERGGLGDMALAWLRDAIRAGHGAIVETKLASAAGGVADRVRKALQAASTAAAKALDEESLPEWFKQGRPAGKVKLPAWLDSTSLTPITIGGRNLAPEHITSVLGVLKDSTLASPGALVADLKKHADKASLEAFVWDLFERWQEARAQSKDKWAMSALGLLGGDGVCLKLAPKVREWPGQAQHKRAVHGLECLRAIGTEQALLQLRKISDKVRFPALKRQAVQFMDEIAKERGLTPSQLEDRIVPDLGLDEQGTRELVYGPRKFRVALGPDLKPRVREESGKIRTDLPKPAAKDDATIAQATQAEWKLFKQQLKEVVKTQSERLEKAMTRRRRWSVEEFEKYLLRHPLMRYLAQVVLWAGFAKDGKAVQSFRVTEDCTCADVNGDPVTLDPQWNIGVIHPLLLSPEELAKWTEVFADHEILTPFAQLGRKTFKLEPAEENETVLKRFEGAQVFGMALLGATKKTGWEQGTPGDSYRITYHYKHFPEVGLTAFITHQPGLEPYGYGGAEDQELGVAYFVPGGTDEARTATAEQALPLGQVDVLVLNEVATLMYALSGKKGA
jgi:hypothetical protein